MNLNNIVITDVLSAITVFSQKGKYEKMKNRVCYALSFTTDGKITYKHNGNSFVSDRNHAVILPKGQSYSIYRQKDGIFPVINFDCQDFLTDTIAVLPIENPEAIMKDFENIKNIIINKENRLMVLSTFYSILHQITRSDCSASNSIAPALAYIEKYYTSPITNEILAGECKISEEYFRKQFRKVTGASPKQYIINMRINKAKQLLGEGILKISAVSEECGFSNPYHFCRLFKQKTGLTPSAFMARNKKYNI